MPEWLFEAAHGLLVVVFVIFFWLVIRLWMHLSRSASACNPEQPAGSARGSDGADPPSRETNTRSGSGP